MKNNMIKENALKVHHPDYRSEILQLLKSNFTPKIIQEQLLNYHENDIASALDVLRKDERIRLYTILDIAVLSDVLEYSENRNKYLGELSICKRVDVLRHLESSDVADYLNQADKSECLAILDLMDEDDKKEISFISSLDEDEIGSKMTTNYIAVCEGISIKDAMQELIKQAAENDNITTIYVVDENELFIGAIDLKDLIVARGGDELSSITATSYPYVYANERIDECIERIKDYSEDSIPVLDSHNRLKGVLISQDITQLVDDVMGEDYAKLAGLTSEEDLHEPLKKSIAKRLPWLILLLGLGLIVSSVVGAFEKVVAELTLIVSFQSLILDMAGNSGTQSLAVTIRVLVDENLNRKQKIYLIAKEARVGITNGMVLGLLSFILIAFYIIVIKGQTAAFAFSVSLCTGIALLLSIVLSSITGTVVPIIFKKMKVDPAVASGPFITTLNDLTAVVTYYGLAWILLINVLGL